VRSRLVAGRVERKMLRSSPACTIVSELASLLPS
jgi:hypothetical protein